MSLVLRLALAVALGLTGLGRGGDHGAVVVAMPARHMVMNTGHDSLGHAFMDARYDGWRYAPVVDSVPDMPVSSRFDSASVCTPPDLLFRVGVVDLGCRDAFAADLGATRFAASIAECAAWGRARNATYVSLRDGEVCSAARAHASLGKSVPRDECRVACRDDSRNTCGGTHTHRVFYIEPERTVTAASAAAADPVPSYLMKLGLRDIGCYLDTPDRAFDAMLVDPAKPTVFKFTLKTCSEWARQKNYTFIGLQAGGMCYAGNNYTRITRYGPALSTDCTYACINDKVNVCGGNYTNRILEVANATWTTLPEFVPPPPPVVTPPPPPPVRVPQLTGNGIDYHGGPILRSAVVYLVWYGDWSTDNTVELLTDFVSNLGASEAATPLLTYWQNVTGVVEYYTGPITYGGSANDHYSRNKTLVDSDVYYIIRDQIAAKALPQDDHGIYLVLTSQDVTDSSGFGTKWCGWHTVATLNSRRLIYGIVGNPVVICPRGCGSQYASPNGNYAADSMASIVKHEIFESITDPYFTGWSDSQGNEDQDKAAWWYDTTYTTANGGIANVKVGTRDWLVQDSWCNDYGGLKCRVWPVPGHAAIDDHSAVVHDEL